MKISNDRNDTTGTMGTCVEINDVMPMESQLTCWYCGQICNAMDTYYWVNYHGNKQISASLTPFHGTCYIKHMEKTSKEIYE